MDLKNCPATTFGLNEMSLNCALNIPSQSQSTRNSRLYGNPSLEGHEVRTGERALERHGHRDDVARHGSGCWAIRRKSTSIAGADGNCLAQRNPHLLLKRAEIASLRQRTLRIEHTVEGLQPQRERLGRVAVY